MECTKCIFILILIFKVQNAPWIFLYLKNIGNKLDCDIQPLVSTYAMSLMAVTLTLLLVAGGPTGKTPRELLHTHHQVSLGMQVSQIP